MSQDRESKLKFYSLGIVIETKPRDTDFIEVSPIEDLPFADGLIKDIKYEYKVKLPDAMGVERETKVKGNNNLSAKWIPFSVSNRITAPDVVKNETVLIWRFADTDEYYWTTIFREPTLRRLETAHYAWSDKKDGLEPFDKDSSYWMEVSTHDKYIHVHTTKSDGERFEYDVKIDTGEGYIEIKDDVGNTFKLDSVSGSVVGTATALIQLKAPEIILDGNVSISGNNAVTGNSDIAGNASITGIVTMSNGATMDGEVIIHGIPV